MNSSFIRIYYLALSILIVLIDQYTKYLIHINFNSIINSDLIILTIDSVKNYGAAFNILSGSRIFLSFISLFISIILVLLIVKKPKTVNLEFYSYSFLLGGTLGNGIDRILRGYVIDFLNLNFIDFPVFNIADISINIGFILLFYFVIKYKK